MLWFMSLFVPMYSFGQHRFSRDVVVKTDTTYECNNMRYESTVIRPNIDSGMILRIDDNPFRVSFISEMKNNYNNGIFLLFYPLSGMPKEKGMFINGDEDGEWFYWNEKGTLIMKKIWRKGKVLKTIKYK